MANYGQYSHRNGVDSSDATDALEQTIFDTDTLFTKFKDDLSPLLSEAELRLDDMGLKKFKNLEHIIRKHVNQWHRLNKNLSDTALEFRAQSHAIAVQLSSAKRNLDERDKIIETQRKDFSNEKEQYENQLKVLESVLANSIPQNSILDKFGMRDEPQQQQQLTQQQGDDNYTIEQLKKDLKIQEQEFTKLQNENKRLSENLKILQPTTNDFQQTLMNLNNEIAKKEDEILKLRWLTQDLAEERNGLETKIQAVTKNKDFTSVTPARQMEYGIDLSKYLDDDDNELSDDAAENGLLSLEMSDDTDGINPEVNTIYHTHNRNLLYIFVGIYR